MYEYVNRAEYAPIRRELEVIIKRVQSEMRKRYQITFQFRLIGSGRRHLITRIRNGNRGYDFDYNLIIRHPGKGYLYKPNIIKRQFMSAFETAIKGTQYLFPKDSTSTITIKVIRQGKVQHSCDFAIIYYEDPDETNYGYYYLRNNKKQGNYEFAFRALNSNPDEKVEDICQYSNGWNLIRKEYLKLKDINEGKEKHSYSIFIETVNNVYNQMFFQ